jgi:hypothetical protein
MKTMGAKGIEHLRQVKDFRVKDGQRHQLWMVLLFVIMGTMSGYVGYRAWGDFVKRHRRVLPIEICHPKTWCSIILNNPKNIDGSGCVTILPQRLINGHKTMFISRHRSGSELMVRVSKELCKTTLIEYQNFVSVVSVFAHNRGQVLGLDKLENKKGSEITTVQNLIAALDIQGVVFSLDALHCQKKLAS